MDFPSPLLRGVLLRRHRRFLADVRLEAGTTVTAHCPGPGLLRGCSDPGSTVLLSDSADTSRRHPLTWEITDVDGTLVCIDAPLCRRIMLETVERRSLPAFAHFQGIQRNAANARHGTVDIMLDGMDRNGFVNLFHITWADRGTALIPEAPAPRLTSAIRQLADIARQGHLAAAFFLVQRADCRVLKPAEDIDREFTRAMLAARSAGVELLAHAVSVTLSGVSLGPSLPVSLD